MLISKEVEIVIKNANIKYYEDKGYNIPKQIAKDGNLRIIKDSIIVVKIEDLPNYSQFEVELKCDYCGKLFLKKWCKYKYGRIKINKDACYECKGKKYSEIKELEYEKEEKIYKIGDEYYNPMKEIDSKDKYKHGIYRIVNLKNKKYYIGSSINLFKRMKEHMQYLKNNEHHSEHLQRSWNKNGEENFIFEVLEYIEFIEDQDLFKDKILEREQYYIDLYNTANDEYGYNICPIAGTVLGTTWEQTEEARIKISNAKKGIPRPDVSGSKHHASHLSDEDVVAIKERIIKGDKIKDIANDYKSDLSSMYDIRNGKTWRYIMPDVDLTMYGKTSKRKLNESLVKEIKDKLLNGIQSKDIENEYNISPSTVSSIKNGDRWKKLFNNEY